MSEVDRLSNSGLYPALPIADKGPSREGSRDLTRDPRPAPKPSAPAGNAAESAVPRPPTSLIDEYA